MDKRQACYLISPPCGGKSTQGRLLSESGITYVDTSELIMREINRSPKSLASGTASQAMRSGKPVNDIMVDNLVANWIKGCRDAEVFIGGYPRNLHQAQHAVSDQIDLLRDYGVILTFKLFYLKVPREKCIERRNDPKAKRGVRLDGDAERVFLERLDVFFATIDPIVRCFNLSGRSGSVVEIDGTMSEQDIFRKLRAPAYATIA